MNGKRLKKSTRSSRTTAAAVLAAVWLTSCGGGGGRLEKAPTSALWVTEAGHVLPPETLRRMEAAGVTELYVPLGELDPASDPLLQRRPLPDLPPSTRVTMVLGGRLVGGLDAASGERAAVALQQLRFDVEARGVVPVGVHLDPESLGPFEELAVFLKALHGALDPGLYLSLSLRRSDLDNPDELLPQALAEVDFVVPFLYGQLLSEAEDGDAWDFERLRERLRVLEQQSVPYLVGVIGLGTATHIAKGGRIKERSTHQSLKSFLWNRKLKLQTGFSLAGADRRIYELAAQSPTQAGGWDFSPGDTVRVVRATTFHLARLQELLESDAHPHCLGQVYYRLTAPDEPLSLSLDNILNVRESTVVVTPDIRLEAHVQRRTARGWLFRFLISNQNGEMTELSTVDSNFLQIHAVDGVFSDDVDTGDFFRYELLRTRDGKMERTFRDADTLRLYIPMIEGQGKVTSGDVEVLMRDPVLRLTGQFLLTDGRSHEVGPWSWSDGELRDERPQAAKSDD